MIDFQYDLRHAEKAKEALQKSLVAGRELDVHFSLPKEEDVRSRACDRDKNQVCFANVGVS
jgi:hypothetical protein